MIFKVQRVNTLGDVQPNVLEVPWKWKRFLRHSQVIQVTHVVIAEGDVFVVFPFSILESN